MKVSLSPKIQQYWISSNSYFSMQSLEKFVKYFVPFLEELENKSNNSNDVIIYDIQDIDTMDNSKLNVMLCVENCSQWSHYKHYNKYGNYGNKYISIYLYNHIDKCVITNNYIAIPVIYLQIDYFRTYYNNIKPLVTTVYNEKKFCLIATSITNDKKESIVNFLKSIDKCDNIKDYSNILKNKSCYHSEELMNIFNKYKFVFVSENSINDGYITEKIFNCFFSRTIPIYYGSNKIDYFFNKESFININSLNFEEIHIDILNILKNEDKYNKFISSDKTNNYDDEEYIIKIKDFIKNYK
jgi:hypothetical protein